MSVDILVESGLKIARKACNSGLADFLREATNFQSH